MASTVGSEAISVPALQSKIISSHPGPLKLSGALAGYAYEDTTPVIGREFLDVNVVDDVLSAENADERLRDLAIISR